MSQAGSRASSNRFRASLAQGDGTYDGFNEPVDEPVVQKAAEPAAPKDHRWNNRHRLTEEFADVNFRGNKIPVEVVNLSVGGAMIRGDFSPNIWEKIDIILGEGEPLECAVRWIKRDHFGLEFAHETQIHCDKESRKELLLDVINRNFDRTEQAENAANEEVRPERSANPSIEELRSAPQRHPLIWMGQVFYNHSTSRVRLRNISSSGAMIESEDYFPKGVEVMLDLSAAGQHFAEVVWARGMQTGLRFRERFNLKLLAYAKPKVASQSWVRPAFLDREVEMTDPWAPNWNRATLADIKDDLEGFMKY